MERGGDSRRGRWTFQLVTRNSTWRKVLQSIISSLIRAGSEPIQDTPTDQIKYRFSSRWLDRSKGSLSHSELEESIPIVLERALEERERGTSMSENEYVYFN